MLSKYHSVRVLVLSSLAILSACSSTPRAESPKAKAKAQAAVARANAEVRGHNGYYALKNVEPGTAKLVVRNVGSQKETQFAMTASVETCKDLKLLGTTFDVARRSLTEKEAYKALKKHGDTTEYIAQDLTPGQPVIVRGIGYWHSDNTYGNKRYIASGRCGPLYSKFTPVEGHAYLIEFEQPTKDCAQGIYDATDPDNPVPLRSEPVTMCPVEAE